MMENDKTMAFYNIKQGSIIHLSLWSSESGDLNLDRKDNPGPCHQMYIYSSNGNDCYSADMNTEPFWPKILY